MQACAKSQALSPGELQPPRVRQKTTTAVARRLIGHALNVSLVHDKVNLQCSWQLPQVSVCTEWSIHLQCCTYPPVKICTDVRVVV